MFKIGDLVTLRYSESTIPGKVADIGKYAKIVSRGSMFDWRIRMLHRGVAVHGDYDWGADCEQIEHSGGPW